MNRKKEEEKQPKNNETSEEFLHIENGTVARELLHDIEDTEEETEEEDDSDKDE